MKFKIIKNIWRVGAVIVVIATFLTQQVSAITQDDITCAQAGSLVCFYEPNGSCISATDTSAITGSVSTTAAAAAIAKIIIGIAKTDNLGQNAALIGIMVGMDESTLQIYANPAVPISESNPAKQASGGTGDSVGVFQQQPDDGWSTYATGSAALTDQSAVWQDMDPAFSAEAFFGTPPGANLPSGLANPGALTMGLQNISGWQSMQPWVAAQAVQGSETASGSNYEEYYAQARSTVNKYWNSAPAVALPVPLSAGSGSMPSGSGYSGNCSVSCNSSAATTTMGLSQTRQNIVCLAEQELQLWQSGQLKPGTNAYFKYSNGRAEEWCADFASWIYNQAGYPFGPAGSNNPSWNVSWVPNLVVPPQDSSKFTYHAVSSGYTPQPGDLAIHGGQHVNIVVSVNGSNITLIGGDQGGDSFPTNVVSEYSLTSPGSDIPPITGFVSPNN